MKFTFYITFSWRNKVMLDMLERRCQGDQANGEKVSVMMDVQVGT